MFGNGHPVLFLHGFLEAKSMWQNWGLDSLNIQSILVDLPGHGDSKNEDDREPSIEFMAEKVLELVHFLGIKQFSIVGHSMGGYVALSLKEKSVLSAELNSQICSSKVILLNSNFWVDSDSKKKDRLRVVDIVMKNKSLFIKEAIPNLFVKKETFKKEIDHLIFESLKMDRHAISYASLAMRNRKDQKKLIEKSMKDFLIIQGELDTIIPLPIMKEHLNGLDVQFKIVPDAGHMAHLESQDEVLKIMSDFLIN